MRHEGIQVGPLVWDALGRLRWATADGFGPRCNARRHKAWIILEDESGISLTPVVRATWAPRGRTTGELTSLQLEAGFRWPSRSGTALTPPRPGSSSGSTPASTTTTRSSLIRQPCRHLRGDKATLCWDLPARHRSHKMHHFLLSQSRVRVSLSKGRGDCGLGCGVPKPGSPH